MTRLYASKLLCGDPYLTGHTAHNRGVARAKNPFAKISLYHKREDHASQIKDATRLWNDGWDEASSAPASKHPPDCHAGKDGECFWAGCPQNRDGEPAKTGRHCPIDRYSERDEL